MNKDLIRFIKNSCLFAIIFVILITILNSFYFSNVLEKKQLYRMNEQYKNYIEKNNYLIVNAFIGDSHTNDAINPKYIPNSFNLASAGANYMTHYYKLNKIIYEDKVRIDYLFLELSPHTFANKFYEEPFLVDEANLWYWHEIIPYSPLRELTGKSFVYLFMQSNFPFIGGGDDLGVLRRGIFGGVWDMAEIYDGWIGNYANLSTENRTEIAYLNYNEFFRGLKTRITPIGKEHLVKILEIANKENITVIYIKGPLSKELLDEINRTQLQMDEYYNEIYRITNETYPNFYVLDYLNAFKEHPEYMGDSTHLNPTGAEVLSRQIADDIFSLNLTKK